MSMLYFFYGTDTGRAREAIRLLIDKKAKKASVMRITDAHTLPDLHTALQGAGMFGGERVIVLDNICSNEEMKEFFFSHLKHISASSEATIIYDSGDLNAKDRKEIEKYAETSERFDAKKTAQQETIFALANALQTGKKKDLWVGYQKELQNGKVPEAIHGVLFWAAKQYLVRNNTERSRAIVAALAELPHEARRRGEDLEYALERFVLSVTPAS